MQGKNLMEQYPKATSIVRDSVIGMLKRDFELSDDITDSDFLTGMINSADRLLINMIENSPHSLFEIFDIHSIHISIIVESVKNKDVLFNYRIIPRDETNSSRYSSDRKTIERYAIEDAFETLNNML